MALTRVGSDKPVIRRTIGTTAKVLPIAGSLTVPATTDAATAVLVGNPASLTGVALTGSYVSIAKRPVSLREAAGVDFTGATDSAAAVQTFLDAAGDGALITIDQRDGIIRCDSTLTLSDFQNLRGGAQKAGGGPTDATFDFSHMGATDTAIELGSSCALYDLHLVGPGAANTSSKGIVCSIDGAVVHLERVTAQRFGHGVHLTDSNYAELIELECRYNKEGLTLIGAYNTNVYQPRFYCTGDDGTHGTGIRTGAARGLNVFGGSIEGYGTIVAGGDEGGIVVQSGALVNVWGTYFEAPGSTNAVSFNIQSATNFILNAFGCEVYLINHRAFIDAEGSTPAGTINSGGHQFVVSTSTTPALPICYFLGSNTGLVVNIGVGQADSGHYVSLAGTIYVSNQGTTTDKQTVRIPREWPTSIGQGELFSGDGIRIRPSTTARAGLNLAQGAAPTSPVNGDVWTSAVGMSARINGISVGVAAPPQTTTALAAIGNAINTTDKYAGKTVYNTTTKKLVTADGATAGAVWVDATGTTAHTPV